MKMVKVTFFLLLTLIGFTSSFAQIDVTSTGGTPIATYATLGEAFTAINTSVHRDVITIVITGNTSEAGAFQLDSSGNGSGSSYTSISIMPVGARTVAGTVAGTMMTLQGADNVLINGLNTGGNSLMFQNSGSGTTTTTMRLLGDASNNRFLNLTFKGGTNTAVTGTGAVVVLGTGLFTGNDNNAFISCNFDGSGTSAVCLYSGGSFTTPAIQNSNDTLLNCNIFDYYNPSTASPIGTFLNSGNTDWLIQGSSWYQTTNRTTGAQGIHTGLQIFPAYTTDQHQVLNNFVGGTGPGATGTLTYTASSTNALGAIGMSLQTGGPGGLIQGNIVRNINVSYAASAGSFGNAGYFLFIGGYDGTCNFNSNTVDNFNITNTLGAALGSGINPNGRITSATTTVRPTFNITNNTVTNMTFNGVSAQFYGMRLEASSGNSLTGTAGVSNPNFLLSGNTISNLNITVPNVNNWVRGIGTLATAGTSSTVGLWPKATINNNTISNINSNSTLVSYTTMSAIGIQIAGSAGTANPNNTIDTFKVYNNSISNINVTTNSTDISNSVGGIQATNSTGYIYNNRIWNITNASAGASGVPIIFGINWRATFQTTHIFNNYVALGDNVTQNASIFGFLTNFSASRPMSVNYNTFYIGGSPTSGTRNTACIYRGNEAFSAAITDTVVAYNNLLVNARTGGSGGHYAIGSFGTAPWFTNYNSLLSGNASTIGYWNAVGSNFATYKASSLNDGASVSAITGVTSDYSVTPNVISPADLFDNATPFTTGNLDIKSTNSASWLVSGKGTPLPHIAVDIHGNSRSITAGTPTDIGADEFTPAVNPPAMTEGGSFTNGGTTTYESFGRTVVSILWNNVGTITTRDVGYYPGATPPGTLDPSGRNSNGYWQVDVNGGASGYNYDITLAYDQAMLGSCVNDGFLRIGKRETPSGDWNVVPSTPNNVNMTITATGLSSFSQFALTDENFPLPVELASFTSVVNANKVTLNWSTLSEINNSGFDIERKNSDASSWARVGNVAGNGTTNVPMNYSFTQSNVEKGKYNYRLKQIDNNGNYKYYDLASEVIVGVPTKFALSQNYPNPFNPSTKINYELPFDSKVSIKLFDMTGKEVASIVNQVQTAGYYTVNFNGANLSSGTYFYTISADGGNQNFSKTLKMMLIK